MKLLGNRVLVVLEKTPPQSGLIIVPQQVEKLPDIGTIVLVGTGRDIPAEITPGKRVRVSNEYGSVEVPGDKDKARIYSIRDVLAILG